MTGPVSRESWRGGGLRHAVFRDETLQTTQHRHLLPPNPNPKTGQTQKFKIGRTCISGLVCSESLGCAPQQHGAPGSKGGSPTPLLSLKFETLKSCMDLGGRHGSKTSDRPSAGYRSWFCVVQGPKDPDGHLSTMTDIIIQSLFLVAANQAPKTQRDRQPSVLHFLPWIQQL